MGPFNIRNLISWLSLSEFYHCVVFASEAPYVRIPCLCLTPLFRRFRRSIFRTDRGIDHPSKLSGRTHQLARKIPNHRQRLDSGILEEEYAVKLVSMRVTQGGLEEAGREETLATLQLPRNIDLIADSK